MKKNTILILVLVFVVSGMLFKGGRWIEKYLKENVSNIKSDIPADYLSLINIDSNYIRHSKVLFADGTPVISLFEYKDNLCVTGITLNSYSKQPLYNIVSAHNDLFNCIRPTNYMCD